MLIANRLPHLCQGTNLGSSALGRKLFQYRVPVSSAPKAGNMKSTTDGGSVRAQAICAGHSSGLVIRQNAAANISATRLAHIRAVLRSIIWASWSRA